MRKYKCVAHTYKSDDLVLVKNTQKNAKDVYQVLWTVMQVNNNGTVNIKKWIVSNMINIRNIHPYATSDDLQSWGGMQ